MLKDQRNIKIKLISWLLLAVAVNNMHYLFYFVSLDVMHLHWQIDIKPFGIPIWWYIHDVFPFFDAGEAESLDIQWYVFFIGGRVKDTIIAYLLYSSVKALDTLMRITVPIPNLYRSVIGLIKVYFFIQVYNVISYVLAAGQMFHGLPILLYFIAILLLFFVRKNPDGKGFIYRLEL